MAKILASGRRFYRFKKTPYMPVEFSGAAYRLRAFSMVREVYSHNRIFTPGRRHSAATLDLLFEFTGLSGSIVGDLAPNPPTGPTADPGAVEQLDHRLAALSTIQCWRPIPRASPLNPSRKIDPFLVPAVA